VSISSNARSTVRCTSTAHWSVFEIENLAFRALSFPVKTHCSLSFAAEAELQYTSTLIISMRDSERRHRSSEARDSHRPVRVKHEETEVTPAARSSRDHSAHRRPTKVKLEPRSSEEATARGYKRSRYDDRTHSRSHYSKGEDRSPGHRRYSREGDRSSPARGERYGRSPDTKPALPSSILGAAPSFKVSAEGGETAKFASNKETDPHKLAQRQKQVEQALLHVPFFRQRCSPRMRCVGIEYHFFILRC
jgi:hypothetical protein